MSFIYFKSEENKWKVPTYSELKNFNSFYIVILVKSSYKVDTKFLNQDK